MRHWPLRLTASGERCPPPSEAPVRLEPELQALRRLEDDFPGSSQGRLLGLDRADDRTLWDHAAVHGFALVTQDADFAEMAALYGPPPKVVWLRGGNRPTTAIEAALRRNHALLLDFACENEAACLELY